MPVCSGGCYGLAIQQTTIQAKGTWLDQAFAVTVLFKDRASVLVFAVKLKHRVDAPRCIPQDLLRRWADGHAGGCEGE